MKWLQGSGLLDRPPSLFTPRFIVNYFFRLKPQIIEVEVCLEVKKKMKKVLENSSWSSV